MPTVTLSGYIIVKPEELAEIRSCLPEHIRLTRFEPGWIKFDVTQDKDTPTKFKVYEEFTDQAAFDFHQKRVASSEWGKVTKNVERHYKVETSR